ncbi:MAG: molybdopterin cofactor-binding domain-containing protein, partial [Gemmatimonadales bacterium]
MSTTLSRRDFLRTGAAAGSGLILAIHLPGCAPRSPREAGGPVETPFAPNAFLKVGTDGSVIVVVGYSEMGQGVLTAVPQLVAEELDVEWERVRVEQAPASDDYFNPMFGLQGTGGSSTVRSAWQPMREAGAKARAMLMSAAAAEWNVPSTECSTEPGFVVHSPSGRRRPYGELAAAAATITVPE